MLFFPGAEEEHRRRKSLELLYVGIVSLQLCDEGDDAGYSMGGCTMDVPIMTKTPANVAMFSVGQCLLSTLGDKINTSVALCKQHQNKDG